MSAIKSIESSSVHKITSGQVVVDLATAVKELLESHVVAKNKFPWLRVVKHGQVLSVITDTLNVAPSGQRLLGQWSVGRQCVAKSWPVVKSRSNANARAYG